MQLSLPPQYTFEAAPSGGSPSRHTRGEEPPFRRPSPTLSSVARPTLLAGVGDDPRKSLKRKRTRSVGKLPLRPPVPQRTLVVFRGCGDLQARCQSNRCSIGCAGDPFTGGHRERAPGTHRITRRPRRSGAARQAEAARPRRARGGAGLRVRERRRRDCVRVQTHRRSRPIPGSVGAEVGSPCRRPSLAARPSLWRGLAGVGGEIGRAHV